MKGIRHSTSLPLYASHAWARLNRFVRWAKVQGWLKAVKLPVRTIGIGNVQAGGTGKTPLTIQIAREAIDRGLSVAILSRGYGSAWEKTGGVIRPGSSPLSPELCGDECALIQDQVPQAWIGVGSDRVAQFSKIQAIVRLESGKGLDLVLLDDALQHWRIECDLYVIAVTETAFGDRYFREDYSAISSKDLIVLTKGSQLPPGLSENLRIVRSQYRLEGANPGMRYHFVAALGDPDRARASLEAAHFRIEEMTVFPDHHLFSQLEVEPILNEARSRGQKILLSGKDWMKWKDVGVSVHEVQVVEPSVECISGGEIWAQVLWGE